MENLKEGHTYELSCVPELTPFHDSLRIGNDQRPFPVRVMVNLLAGQSVNGKRCDFGEQWPKLRRVQIDQIQRELADGSRIAIRGRDMCSRPWKPFEGWYVWNGHSGYGRIVVLCYKRCPKCPSVAIKADKAAYCQECGTALESLV